RRTSVRRARRAPRRARSTTRKSALETEAFFVNAQELEVGLGLLTGRDLSGLDGFFEHSLHVADLARRRQAESAHDRVADAARQRGDLCVFFSEMPDAVLELFDLLKAFALLLGPLGGDIGTRPAEQILEVGAQLARESPDRAVGPVGRVLVGAQVMEHEKANRLFERRLRREEAKAPIELVEHPGPDLGVAEKVDLAVGRDRPRLDLPDVVRERRPPGTAGRDGRTPCFVCYQTSLWRHSPSPKPTMACTSGKRAASAPTSSSASRPVSGSSPMTTRSRRSRTARGSRRTAARKSSSPTVTIGLPWAWPSAATAAASSASNTAS